MCRFVAYVGEPVSARDVVFGGGHSLYEQSWAPRELLSGSVNADGYGVVWYGEDGPARIAEPRPIWHDSELENTLASISARCVVAALRNTTPGIAVDRSGLLPLRQGPWSFVLNGFVPAFRTDHMRALRAALPDDLYALLEGSSDSETLFLLAVAALREGATLGQALQSVAATVHERVGGNEAQLNMLLCDGTALSVVRASTVLVTNSMYVARRPPFAPHGIVIASEPPDLGAAWETVDAQNLLEVDRDGAIRSEAIVFD